MFKKIVGCVVLVSAVFLNLSDTCYAWGRAEVDAQCRANNATYSTRTQRCVCNSGYTESGGTCVRSGSSSGSSSTPSRDYEAERRAQEQAEAERRAEEARQAELERQRREAENKRLLEEAEKQRKFLEDRDAAAGTLRGSTGTGAVSSGLGGTGLRGSAASGGSGLRGSSADTGLRGLKTGTTQEPNTDPMVVDARVAPMGANLLSQVPELERSPAADRIRKGFKAIMNVPRDWPVALAWWQEALQRDPNNAALIRSVDLAQWMVDSKKRAANRQPHPALDAFLRGNLNEFNRLIEQASRNNAIQLAEAERIKKIVDKQVKQRAAAPKVSKLSPKSATMAKMAIAGDRALSEQMFEDGLLFDLFGMHEEADKMFQMAGFQRMFEP